MRFEVTGKDKEGLATGTQGLIQPLSHAPN